MLRRFDITQPMAMGSLITAEMIKMSGETSRASCHDFLRGLTDLLTGKPGNGNVVHSIV